MCGDVRVFWGKLCGTVIIDWSYEHDFGDVTCRLL